MVTSEGVLGMMEIQHQSIQQTKKQEVQPAPVVKPTVEPTLHQTLQTSLEESRSQAY